MSFRRAGGLQGMSEVRVHISVSADAYVAGPNHSLENPLGEGGEDLHDWVVALKAWREPHGMEGGEVNASTPVVEESLANVGAEVMGRGKFGGGPGPWGDGPWRAGGARSRRSTCPSSSSPITSGNHSRSRTRRSPS